MEQVVLIVELLPLTITIHLSEYEAEEQHHEPKDWKLAIHEQSSQPHQLSCQLSSVLISSMWNSADSIPNLNMRPNRAFVVKWYLTINTFRTQRDNSRT